MLPRRRRKASRAANTERPRSPATNPEWHEAMTKLETSTELLDALEELALRRLGNIEEELVAWRDVCDLVRARRSENHSSQSRVSELDRARARQLLRAGGLR